mmetsp:Transcript_92669/g.128618  ORF Transcript_92669/g.128618 Transcript_92669/m.128618 type:complete len:200 (-) Transcript_92669:482-1081(-)
MPSKPGLARGEVEHDLLGAASHREDAYLPVGPLHDAARPRPKVRLAAENLRAFTGHELEALRRLNLRQGDGACKLLRGICWPGFLRTDGLDHAVGGHNVATTFHELVADDLMCRKRLAEGLSHLCVSDRLFQADPGLPVCDDRQSQPLIVEVPHDCQKTITFSPQQVLCRHLDLVKGHQGRGAEVPSLRLQARRVQTST